MACIDWISFVIASIAVVLAPGPGSLFVARTAAVSGSRAGYAAMLGIMAGDTCLIMLSTLGVSVLFAMYPSMFDLFRLVGAGYLVFLGLRLLFKGPRTRSSHVPNRDRSFMQALSVTLLNPKAFLFFMAFFPMFIRSPGHGRFFAYAVMAAAFQVISAAYLSALVGASSWTASTLQRNGTARIVLEKLCGCAFIGFGMKVALSKR